MKPIRIKRIKGFTLVEMLVVIAISCLLAGMIYTGVRFFLIIYQKNRIQNQLVNAVYTLQTGLSREFQSSTLVHFNSAENTLSLITLPSDTVTYAFSNEMIIRCQLNCSDTLPIQASEINPFFEDQPVTTGIIDRISMNITYGKQKAEINYKKAYSPWVVINRINPVTRAQIIP